MSIVVTISASYGTDGRWVGVEVAKRLGCRFIDRGIPVQVAERLTVPVEHAEAHDETAAPPFTRLLARIPNTNGVVLPEATTDAFCRETERLIVEAARSGDVVVCGRAGALVLRGLRGALHVRLDGPERARVAHAMRLEGIDEREARRRQRASDRAQIDYVKHFYGADPRDWRHYHILLNSAALSSEECVTSIVNAAGSSAAPPAWQTTIEGTRV